MRTPPRRLVQFREIGLHMSTHSEGIIGRFNRVELGSEGDESQRQQSQVQEFQARLEGCRVESRLRERVRMGLS